MQQKASWCILLMLNMAVPLQQKPIAAAGYTNTAVTNTVDTGDLDIANGESDPDGYVNGEADMDTQTSATDEEPFHYILSLATGMFVAITKSGRVQANAQINRVSQFYRTHSISDDGKEYVTLKSRKYQDWYLTLLKNGKFRGSIPSGGNERFEMVNLESAVALKANINIVSSNMDYTNRTINATNNSTSFSGSGSGSGMDTGNNTETHNRTEVLPHDTQTQDCYLGFAFKTGRPHCYNSTNYSQVHLLFIDGIGG